MRLIKRIVFFYRRNGLRSTARRSWAIVQRTRHLGKMCLYECNLPVTELATCGHVSVEQVVSCTLSENDLDRLLDSSDPGARYRQMKDRFAAGSALWLARVNGKLAGYGWTLQGRTIEPHFFPLLKDDVHFYDFFVYPEFRGCGINVVLVNQILCSLNESNARRAMIECAAWNTPQLRSLGKTRFRLHAIASKWCFFGRAIVLWHCSRFHS